MKKKKMKIGIVTIYDNENYGNRLQNYAVTQVLKKMFNHSIVESLVLCGSSMKKGYMLREFVVQKICAYYPKLMKSKVGMPAIRMLKIKEWGERIPLRKIYDCNKIPDEYGEKYDLFVVGSDQVWNYKWSSSPHFKDYFLDFTNRKKVAFSASIGVADIEDDWKAFFAEKLDSFGSISVREDAASVALKEITGYEIPVLIDPTMMLTQKEWCRVAKKAKVNTQKKYILKFFLGNNEENERVFAFAKQNDMLVYDLTDMTNMGLYTSGPGEFISLVKNAELVCTNSFHGVVFSILFHRPFIVFDRKQKNICDMSSRIDTLLSKFKLETRKIESLESEQWLECDYSHVEEILQQEREKVKDFFRKAIF